MDTRDAKTADKSRKTPLGRRFPREPLLSCTRRDARLYGRSPRIAASLVPRSVRPRIVGTGSKTYDLSLRRVGRASWRSTWHRSRRRSAHLRSRRFSSWSSRCCWSPWPRSVPTSPTSRSPTTASTTAWRSRLRVRQPPRRPRSRSDSPTPQRPTTSVSARTSPSSRSSWRPASWPMAPRRAARPARPRARTSCAIRRTA